MFVWYKKNAGGAKSISTTEHPERNYLEQLNMKLQSVIMGKIWKDDFNKLISMNHYGAAETKTAKIYESKNACISVEIAEENIVKYCDMNNTDSERDNFLAQNPAKKHAPAFPTS
uniref:Uncharacterized protein n=1 Tax=Romanomermis culicivorax TaxID=13658 RepID=A0A915HK18_ROMCU